MATRPPKCMERCSTRNSAMVVFVFRFTGLVVIARVVAVRYEMESCRLLSAIWAWEVKNRRLRKEHPVWILLLRQGNRMKLFFP